MDYRFPYAELLSEKPFIPGLIKMCETAWIWRKIQSNLRLSFRALYVVVYQQSGSQTAGLEVTGAHVGVTVNWILQWCGSLLGRRRFSVSAVFSIWYMGLRGTSACSAGRTAQVNICPLHVLHTNTWPGYPHSLSPSCYSCLTRRDGAFWKSLQHQDVKTIRELTPRAPSPLLSIPPCGEINARQVKYNIV